MSLNAFSCFYYGFEVTADNCYLDFAEGGSELTAEVPVGSYTATEFAVAIKTALDDAGANTYQVAFNRTTRKITISASSTFTLKLATGTHIGSNPWALAGFTQGADLTGAITYTGATAAGSMYEPQFKLQEYVSSSDLQQAVDATINKTASGRVEVVRFGTEKFIEMNIKFVTDIVQDGNLIKSNPSGVDDARAFLRFAITKAPFEFMESSSQTSVFETVILESTAESNNGTGYRLREMYDKGLPGYYETGKLKLRVLE